MRKLAIRRDKSVIGEPGIQFVLALVRPNCVSHCVRAFFLFDLHENGTVFS